MILLFSGAIAYNVFFIQTSLRQQAKGPALNTSGMRHLAAGAKPRGKGRARRMVRVRVRPSGMHGRGADSAFSALVLATQRELAALGHYSGRIDGRYGKTTRSAIARYQRQAGLSATGRPDQATLDRLQYDRRLAQAARYTASVTPPAKAERDIRFIQERLARLGYETGHIDGRVGPSTRRAIRQFQADRGWPVTGRIDSRLLSAFGR